MEKIREEKGIQLKKGKNTVMKICGQIVDEGITKKRKRASRKSTTCINTIQKMSVSTISTEHTYGTYLSREGVG